MCVCLRVSLHSCAFNYEVACAFTSNEEETMQAILVKRTVVSGVNVRSPARVKTVVRVGLYVCV